MYNAKRSIPRRLTAMVIALCLAISPLLAYAEGTAYRKQDISNAVVSVGDQEFTGFFIEPEVEVRLDGKILTAGEDYSLVYENNVNIGTATVHVIGNMDYYGSVTKDFQITYGNTTVTLPGAYCGTYPDGLNDQVTYAEGYLSPGVFRAYTDCDNLHYAFYSLYRVDGDTPTLILEETKGEGLHNDTMFTYDFSSVYNSTAEEGGEVYILAYFWITRTYATYSGMLVMYISAEAEPATYYTAHRVPDGDFRKDYYTATGVDGYSEKVIWSTSDPSIATIDENGVFTWKKPGSVSVTAEHASGTFFLGDTMTALDITEGAIDVFSVADQTAEIVYDGMVLIPETDYTMTVTETDGITEVTVTGCGLFTGQLVRQYNTATGEALDHSHGFTDSCDETCESCDFSRTDTHKFSSQWSKDVDYHWHACTACGEKTDYAEHSLSPEDSEVCTVCGPLVPPGDIDCNMLVNRDDVVQLLLHVSMPEAFPLQVPADFTGDEIVNRDDVVQLLLHVSMPEAFPLQV